jgi:outer membrane protein assembly factor BamD (BamD/ComL family)
MAPTSLAEMLAYEPYNKGRELINAGDYEAAITHFSNLLEATKEASGELSEVGWWRGQES